VGPVKSFPGKKYLVNTVSDLAQDANVPSYYAVCNTTSPDAVEAVVSNAGSLPFDEFGQCLPTLDSIDCSSPDYGFPSEGAGFWQQSLLPTGTSSLHNNGGVMTSPVAGPSIVWNLFGNSAPADLVTAVAAPFKAAATATSVSGSTGAATTSSTKSGEGDILSGMRKEQIYANVVVVALLALL
jgi:hypothetical protein